jgi:hypothetical protein
LHINHPFLIAACVLHDSGLTTLKINNNFIGGEWEYQKTSSEGTDALVKALETNT